MTITNSVVALKAQADETLNIVLFVGVSFWNLLDYNLRPGSYGNCVGMVRCFAECLSRFFFHLFCPASFVQRARIGHTGFEVGTFLRRQIYVLQIYYAQNEPSKQKAFLPQPNVQVQFSDFF